MRKSHCHFESMGEALKDKKGSDRGLVRLGKFKGHPVEECEKAFIACKAGDLILWDSRTMHANTCAFMPPETSSNELLRLAAYVCMTPQLPHMTKEFISQRVAAPDSYITTNHKPYQFRVAQEEPARTNLKQLRTVHRKLDLPDAAWALLSGFEPSPETPRTNEEVEKEDTAFAYVNMRPKKPKAKQNFRYLVVVDFEATMTSSEIPMSEREIIEFPAVLVDTRSCMVVDEFHEFVRPTLHPVLEPQVTELTSVTQSQVASADVFEQVQLRFDAWLRKKRSPSLFGKDEYVNFIVVTCGNWDLKTQFPLEMARIGQPVPHYLAQFINVKHVFSRQLLGKSQNKNMKQMLNQLGLELQGHHHSGIDDTRNIANICLELLGRGCLFHTK